jgi:hypothetical protein
VSHLGVKVRRLIFGWVTLRRSRAALKGCRGSSYEQAKDFAGPGVLPVRGSAMVDGSGCYGNSGSRSSSLVVPSYWFTRAATANEVASRCSIAATTRASISEVVHR